MYVPWLADAARSTGYPVVEIAGWRARGHGGMRRVEGVVGHHTATSAAAPGDYPSLGIVTNGRSDLAGPLANYGLGRNGTIYVIAAGCAYHAGASRWAGFIDLNDEFLGIEAESAGTGVWTPAQLDCYPRLTGAVLRYMSRGTDRYAGHKDVCVPVGRKPDPVGIDSAWMRHHAANPLPIPTNGEDEDMSSDVGEATGDEWGELHVPVNGHRYLRISSAFGRTVTLDGISLVDDTPAGAGSNGKTVQAGGRIASDRPGPWDLAKTDPNYVNYSHLVIRYRSTGKVKAWVNDRP
ncbi:N-acetylmuramoyl-L-alanine amidase [Amycolatopsis sp. NPDC052450]|uniref:N-acetylmuramoyl-L-alanine amidase n=1 Tax=Amycolatopsis sp. NPDC052450 TaxID=3363937 RepID=UPI0037C6937E